MTSKNFFKVEPSLLRTAEPYSYILTPIQLTRPTNTPLKSTPTLPTHPSDSFTDVASGAYYADAVKWAVDKEITTGTTATMFMPNTTCTTGQILTFLWRANGSPAPTIANPFTDVKESDYFYQAALWANQKGMVSETVFSASAPCTRSATVTYLWKLAGEPTTGSEAAFADVPSGVDYAKSVAWAGEQGHHLRHQCHHVCPGYHLHPRPDCDIPISGYGKIMKLEPSHLVQNSKRTKKYSLLVK